MNSSHEFSKTEEVLRKSKTIRYDNFSGSHRNLPPEVSKRGRVISEVIYEPAKHAHTSPSIFSVKEELIGEEHVDLRQSLKFFNPNLIIDLSSNNDIDWIGQAKKDTVLKLVDLFGRMFTGQGDFFNNYIINGNNLKKTDQKKYPDLLRGSEKIDCNPEDLSREIARICQEGLTIIISGGYVLNKLDRSLPSEELVILKVDHLFAKNLPSNIGKFVTGEKANPVINTSDKKQLEAWNQELARRRKNFINYLASLGLKNLVEVVYEGSSVDPDYGFNVSQTDQDIALVLERVIY